MRNYLQQFKFFVNNLSHITNYKSFIQHQKFKAKQIKQSQISKE